MIPLPTSHFSSGITAHFMGEGAGNGSARHYGDRALETRTSGTSCRAATTRTPGWLRDSIGRKFHDSPCVQRDGEIDDLSSRVQPALNNHSTNTHVVFGMRSGEEQTEKNTGLRWSRALLRIWNRLLSNATLIPGSSE